jgi:aryl-alcohol dehydrogenase-like predicted oxidoreductase
LPLGTPHDRAPDRRIFEVISKLAEARGVPNAAIVFAWCRSRQGLSSSLIGATKEHHISQAVASLETTLTTEEIAAIDEPYEPRAVFGHVVKPH